jgi:hypothetical protein
LEGGPVVAAVVAFPESAVGQTGEQSVIGRDEFRTVIPR